jgi:hypothetical protein
MTEAGALLLRRRHVVGHVDDDVDDVMMMIMMMMLLLAGFEVHRCPSLTGVGVEEVDDRGDRALLLRRRHVVGHVVPAAKQILHRVKERQRESCWGAPPNDRRPDFYLFVIIIIIIIIIIITTIIQRCMRQ